MRVTYQLVCYVTTLLGLLFIGSLFDTVFRQVGFHAKHMLPGVPLPRITEFLITHHHLPRHLVLFPWLAFLGAPLLSSSAFRRYWQASDFLLRFTMFLVLETLLLLLLVFAAALPFVPYYGVMSTWQESAAEFTVRFLFWIMAALVAVALVLRLRWRRS